MRKRISALLSALLIFVISCAGAEALTVGSSGDEVTALQERLIELGLLGGTADGIYGKNTAAAVGEAQRLLSAEGYDVAATEEADKATAALIFDEAARDALMTLRHGSKGARVRELQKRLIDLKLLDGYADGSFGSATEAAVKRFQHELSALGASVSRQDGAVDGATLALLNEDLSAYGFKAPIYYDASNPSELTADYLYSSGCVVIDAPTGEVLFGSGEHLRLYPASTTKIMTLLVALERSDIDDIVTIPDCALDVPADSSLVPVLPGERMSMENILYGLMMNSGNDAANAIAELCAGSTEAFARLMNERAVSIGMTDTHFVNPHGYHDDEHFTTAYDMALLAREGLTNPMFCKIATCMRYTMPATEKREPLIMQNTCEIFDPASPFHIEGAAGVKKGFTSLAGFCYVGAAQRGTRTLIAAVLHTPGREYAWQDLKKLFEYGFAH